MEEKEVIELMESSKTEAEWNLNADIVQAKCGGYPSFWFKAIVVSGIADKVASKWGGDAKIRITNFSS